ncbi:MAG: 16S rRNA (guanine(527)-N(7))-methyltransferase RsmG [Marinilabiliales bacterium]|nr:MAG: 16S rRNA (guanine(527)-N(7))-methyltransferase RsmG [Marinilabiliales bacterium]
MGTQVLARYFPGLGGITLDRFKLLESLYVYWNSRINVISRKDISNLYINHVLHSLSLAKVINFSDGEALLDIGTGGGFPGIPLAVMFPHVDFTLVDSTRKKIRVVESVARELGLDNVRPVHTRAEELKGQFNYVVSRAVCLFPVLVSLSSGRLNRYSPSSFHGIYSLKGGDVDSEVEVWKEKVRIFDISDLFAEDFFLTKKIVFLPAAELKCE